MNWQYKQPQILISVIDQLFTNNLYSQNFAGKVKLKISLIYRLIYSHDNLIINCLIISFLKFSLEIFDQILNGKNLDYCLEQRLISGLYINIQEIHYSMKDNRAYSIYNFFEQIFKSVEEVAHTIRTNEYSNKIESYQWVLKRHESQNEKKFMNLKIEIYIILVQSRKNFRNLQIIILQENVKILLKIVITKYNSNLT
ncbi:unnamed protein product [Paramecium sonneborni]|uniref:Glutamyl/glutaminyl-tRNA synthetase class Ib catalytic domain-containing protein n=1 Tax=Paramecium sonneborni TaxID=65129 RepID=A0A8S1RM45_9CILI|nr:unnamed protein product [Paramecium sonneborni]